MATLPAVADGHEAATLQTLGIERQAKTVVPEDLDHVAPPTAKREQIAGEWVEPQRLLDLEAEPVHVSRMSVLPFANHMRTPDGTGIIGASEGRERA